MKNETIVRDANKQNEFKNKLIEESKQLYGSKICYASHKPYKGLIASHIKPYKICELEGDLEGAFDINNGLLLDRNVDAYFDKFDITFGSDGKIICSDAVPKEIQNDFVGYHLDESVLNETRQAYLNIHRSLYFYKNYCQADPQPVNPLKNIQIPYYNCGIKAFNNNVIFFENGYWHICSPNKVKALFVNRTGEKISTLISSVDFASNLLQTKEYQIVDTNNGFNCNNGVWSIEKEAFIDGPKAFSISSANYSVSNDVPESFLDLLSHILGDDQEVEQFRQILNVSLQGHGLNKCVVLKGNQNCIEKLVKIMREVLGSYLYEIKGKEIYISKSTDVIPNCRIILIRLIKSYTPEQSVLNSVLNNSYYQRSDLNIDKYVPFYIMKNASLKIDDSIEFSFSDYPVDIDVDHLLKEEGNKILGWMLRPYVSDYSGIEDKGKTTFYSENKTIKIWMENVCGLTNSNSDLISATDLYNSYVAFCTSNNWKPISDKKFFRSLTKIGLGKIRRSGGMYYCGVSFL